MKTFISSINIMIALILMIGASLSSSASADANAEYSFSAIWRLVRARAPEISAAGHELESARINEQRMSRHWYPRVFAEGRVFSTNDPALTFMSLLGQRQIAAADFIPQTLNQPGGRFFERATLGIDFPLFEGGAKVAMNQSSSKMTAAKSFELRSAEVNQYADLANAYSSILSLQRQKVEFEKLANNLEQTISQYKIGSKSNPVGYSGILGLKNLNNRLKGLMIENSAKIGALHQGIGVVAKDLPSNWMPKPESVKTFVSSYLNPKELDDHGSGGTPALVSAMRLSAESLEDAKNAERARFLPKVGLFGTGDLYGGSRGSATSYTGGAYLQWDVFSAQNYGSISQAEHAAAAAQARVEATSERTQIERSGAVLSVDAIEQNLSLMEESSKLLEEQTATAKSLFRNGSINALQLVEVLARRVDLSVSRAEAEQSLAQSRVKILVNSGADGVLDERQ